MARAPRGPGKGGRRWSWRRIPAIGAAFILLIVALSAYDVWRSHRDAVAQTERELDQQARIIADQTARSVQAIDLVLRHVVGDHRSGRLADLAPAARQDYLNEQRLGLAPLTGLSLHGADGVAQGQGALQLDADEIEQLASAPEGTLQIGKPVRSARHGGGWVIPLARRFDDTPGRFTGAVVGAVRVEGFGDFYRRARLDDGTRISLVRHDGTLLARDPPLESALGQRFKLFDDLLTAGPGWQATVSRVLSPVDGVERFAALQLLPDYPLAIIVARDASMALATWRQQAIGTGLRTLALGLLAALLLGLFRAQFERLDRTRASLEVSRERFALAAAGADVGIWDWDMDGDRVFASERAREIFGLPPGPEVRLRSEWFESVAIHPDDMAARREAVNAHLAGRTPSYEHEFRVRGQDGQYRWVRVSALCVRNAAGEPTRMAGSVADIDGRKRAEEALRRSEERYELAVAGSSEGLWDWDLSTDQLFLSPRAQELLWLSPGEPQRSRRDWIACTRYHPDDRPRVRRAIADHLRGRTLHFQVEYRVQHHSGRWHWYRQRGIAVRDAQGRPTRMAGSMEDITERKAFEADRDRLEAELRQAQKLEAIGTLAGGIAHDFNNILAAILGYGEMAKKDAPEGSAQRRHLDAAINAGLRAKSLVERILAFSRTGVAERVPVHVGSVVAEALGLVAASLPAGISLVRDLRGGDAAVLGDPTQIHQVVMNLCANAVQAMKASGTLNVSLELAHTAAGAGVVRLRVADTGVGIAPGVRERIFDPFFTTKEVGVGTGLGLSLVHGIVTDLGGSIEVDSQPGQGATFTVTLPWQSCVAPPAVDAPRPPPGGRGETILFVDDEEALVALGEELIAELGYEPVGFTSSLAALEAFQADPGRFDAVLSDEAMPEMTGSALAREIRLRRPDLPVVLMSGYVTAALAQRARDAGVREVLAKPLSATELAHGLARALKSVAAAPVDPA